jgi:predicted Ser/Thr protein kinase
VLGQTLGSYTIERELGRGGMGVVYVGRHQLLDRTAAIKVLRSQDQESVQRFFNEARAASAIKHPGIIEIYDYGTTDGNAYIVMELCEGESLTQRIRRERDMPLATVLAIAKHIASTLGAAHAAGIVHRDLKPDNVFVIDDPDIAGGKRIKLLDFGIAKLASADDAPSRTRTGVIMGTPYYMSPEQCRGAGQVDHRTDLYALGCILFEMVCGRIPFRGEGTGDIIGAHLLTPPPSPTSLAPKLPPEVDALILALLAKKPGDRPQSADAVIEAIVRIAGTLSPTLVIARAQVELDPNASTQMPVSGNDATLASGNDGTLAETHVPPVAIPRRRRWWPVALVGLAAVGGIGFAIAMCAGGAPVPIDAPPADAALDVRTPRLVIGTLDGDAMTEGIRAKIRPQLAAQIEKISIHAVSAPTEADRRAGAAGRALEVGGTLKALDFVDGEVRCKFSLWIASYPDENIFASAQGGGRVKPTSTAITEMEIASADCVEVVIEDMLARQILPVFRDHLAK